MITSDKSPAGETRPRRRTDIISRNIEGETVILHREAGVLHKLNPTAGYIWTYCDGTQSIDEIVDRLVAEYDIDSATCRKDVSDVVSQFRRLDLLVPKL